MSNKQDDIWAFKSVSHNYDPKEKDEKKRLLIGSLEDYFKSKFPQSAQDLWELKLPGLIEKYSQYHFSEKEKKKIIPQFIREDLKEFMTNWCIENGVNFESIY